MIGFPVKDSSNPRFGGWFFLDPSVVLGRELAPFRDHSIRPTQKLFIPAVIFGIEALHGLTGDHVLVVEFMNYQIFPNRIHLTAEFFGLSLIRYALTPRHDIM